jgi:thiol-disulfide isomerase/thioredoxin
MKGKSLDIQTGLLLVLIGLAIVYLILNSREQEEKQQKEKFRARRLKRNERFHNPQSDSKMVMFYVDWCPHCQKAKPIWKKLGDKLSNKLPKLKLEMVNGEENRKLAEKYEIQYFPTILYINGDSVVEYEGERELEPLTNFAVSQS